MDIDRHKLAHRGLNAPMRRLTRGLASALGLTAALNYPATALAGNTFIVNTTGDPGNPGTLSLRQAVAAADTSNGNTVQFDPSLAGSTITLTTGQIIVTHAMNIIGPGADKLTISGGYSSRVFSLNCSDANAQVLVSSLTLSNGKVTYGDGGALFSYKCKLLLSAVRVTASQGINGGGVAFNNGTITNSVVSGCHAEHGGGIAVTSGPGNPKIYTTTVRSNIAVYGGGGVYLNYVNLKGATAPFTLISQSTISNNTVTKQSALNDGGGGILASQSSLWLYYSTVAQNNSYRHGGGVAFRDSFSANYSKLIRATVALNSSSKTYGNGIYSVGGTVGVGESIIAGNFNKYGLTDLSGSFILLNSLAQSPGSATIGGSGSKLGVDPDLANLDDNGGPTATMLPNPGSPAIDAGELCFTHDQRGLDGCVGGGDMGAVERQIPEVIIFRNAFESG